MFGLFKNKKTKKNARLSVVKGGADGSHPPKGEGQSLAGDALRAQALANAKAARENIGEDTLERIAAAMAKKQQSPMEQAKRKIENADAERVASEILSMLETRH